MSERKLSLLDKTALAAGAGAMVFGVANSPHEPASAEASTVTVSRLQDVLPEVPQCTELIALPNMARRDFYLNIGIPLTSDAYYEMSTRFNAADLENVSILDMYPDHVQVQVDGKPVGSPTDGSVIELGFSLWTSPNRSIFAWADTSVGRLACQMSV